MSHQRADARKAAAEKAGGAGRATADDYRWLRDNLPLDNLGHITSCAAIEGDNCRCATFARRLADVKAAAYAEGKRDGAAAGDTLAAAIHALANEWERLIETEGMSEAYALVYQVHVERLRWLPLVANAAAAEVTPDA